MCIAPYTCVKSSEYVSTPPLVCHLRLILFYLVQSMPLIGSATLLLVLCYSPCTSSLIINSRKVIQARHFLVRSSPLRPNTVLPKRILYVVQGMFHYKSWSMSATSQRGENATHSSRFTGAQSSNARANTALDLSG